jgi:hypothetical protein
MRISRLHLPIGGPLAAILLASMLLGCGSSEYNRMVSNRVADLRGEEKFRTLFAPTQLGDTPVRIRLPMIFQESYVEGSKHKEDGPQIAEDRLQPPFLKLPGFKICYEGKAYDQTPVKTYPYYCYLGVVPSKPGDAENLAKELQAQLKATFKDTPDQWESMDVDSPSGNAVQWKKIRVEGEQSFRFKQQNANKATPANLPGIFELWLCDKTDYVVLVAWRVPTSIQGVASVPVPTSLHALLTGPKGNMKLDLATFPVLTAGTITVDAPDLADKG